ncbi:unnamed protein product [Echinostoma caproni]|uniref:Uncharacterized protein n=1 Tax=Echinostoma caproni TaxID=27848 RepID=A0A3P8LAV6_9TREM|nr:unnamed protein product [Echinostoma caproni]
MDRINQWIETNKSIISGNTSFFDAVELCNLEYTSDRGACIVPHLDDVWLWGDRLITLNLCSPTVLCFTLPTNSSSAEVIEELRRIQSILAPKYPVSLSPSLSMSASFSAAVIFSALSPRCR